MSFSRKATLVTFVVTPPAEKSNVTCASAPVPEPVRLPDELVAKLSPVATYCVLVVSMVVDVPMPVLA